MGLSNNDTPTIAALYARVSTQRQENEQTIKSQIDEIETKIKEDKCILPITNKFLDNGWSGDLLARPGLDLLRDGCKNNLFGVVYVYDLGRLSRNFMNQLILMDEIQNSGIKVISLHDINAETEEQSFARNVMGLFHDFEKKKIAERFRRGKLYRAGQGVIISGGALYGYTYIKRTKKTGAKIVRNDKTIEVVNMILSWFGNEGFSIRKIIKELYRQGIQPPKGKKDTWSKGTITRLLKCKTYFTGIAYYNKSEAVVPKYTIKDVKYRRVKKSSRVVRPKQEWIKYKIPIINKDIDLFYKIQKILEDNKRYASKRRKYEYLLTGKTFCECGFRRVGDGYTKGQNHYYRSAARIYRFPKESNCNCQGVNAIVLDTMFWNKFKDILADPEMINKLAERWIKQQTAMTRNLKDEIASINNKLESLRQEGLRYAKMYASDQIDADQFEELMRGLKKRKACCLEDIEEIKRRARGSKIADIDLDDLCQEAVKVIQSLELINRRQIIKDLVDKIVIKKGGDEVETWINIPLTQAHLMGYGTKRRNSRTAKCGEVHTV